MKLVALLHLYLLSKVETAVPKKKRCLDINRIAWRQSVPYAKIVNGSHNGIVEQIFFNAMSSCCVGDTNYVYPLEFKSQAGIPDLLMDEATKYKFDFMLPVQKDYKSKNFLIFPFVPLVVSPGLAVFVTPSSQGTDAIFQSVKAMIPFMTVIFICVGIAGTTFWMLDNMTLAMYGESPEPFSKGIINGCWWAIVTMSTVGYGDIVPRTKPARIFSVIWVIVGLIFCGLCVSSLTSGILISITKSEIELMNKKIAVLRGSEEYKYASKKQGITFEYDTVEEVIESLRSENVTIALLDAMIAGSYSDLLNDFTLNKVIETISSNGVIFLNEGAKFSKCFREYIMDRQQDVLNLVSKNVKTVHYQAIKGDAVLIDPSLPMFRIGILSMLGTLMFFVIVGVSRDWLSNYFNKRMLKKKNENQLVLKRQELKRELLRDFKDIVDICNFFITNLDEDAKKAV